MDWSSSPFSALLVLYLQYAIATCLFRTMLLCNIEEVPRFIMSSFEVMTLCFLEAQTLPWTVLPMETMARPRAQVLRGIRRSSNETRQFSID